MANNARRFIDIILRVTTQGVEAAITSFKKLKESITGTTTATNTLTTAQNKNAQSSKKQGQAFDDLSKKQKKSKKELTGLRKEVAEFSKGLLTAVKFIARFAVAFAVLGAIREVTIGAFKAFRDFEAAIRDLQAVSGATAKETQNLSKVILEVAGSTKFLAVELAATARDLLRLGFSATATAEALEGIATLSQATGESLNETAVLVAKTINAFSLTASESTRIANAFTVAINESALSLEFLGTSVQYAAPLAQQLGVSLEETVSVLGVLANAGFKASRAGTGLRQVFLELGATAGSLVPILEELKDGKISLSDAEDLVGKRAAAQLLVLIDQVEVIKELTVAQDDYVRALQATAVQLSSIEGQQQLLNAAWDKFLVNIGRAVADTRVFIDLITLLDNKSGKLARNYQFLNRAQDEAGVSLDDFIRVLREEGDEAFDEGIQSLAKLTGSVDFLNGKLRESENAQAFREFIRTLAEGAEIEENAIATAKERTQAYKDAVEALSELAEVEFKSLENTEARNALYEDIETKLRRVERTIENNLNADKETIRTLQKQAEILNGLLGIIRNITFEEEERVKRAKELKVELQEFKDFINASSTEQLVDAFNKIFDRLERARKIGDSFGVAQAQAELAELLRFIESKGLTEEFTEVSSAMALDGMSDELSQNLKDARKLFDDNIEEYLKQEKEFSEAFGELGLLGKLIFGLGDGVRTADAVNKAKQIAEDIRRELGEQFSETLSLANETILKNTLQRLDIEKLAIDERYDYEEKRLKVLQEEGIINATQYERELLKIKEKRIQEENKIAKKEFEANKVNTLAQIAIDTAQAIVAALDKPYLIPIIAAGAAIQTGIVARQEYTPVRYEEGGMVEGRSHAQGGVPFTVQGRGGYEMEGGEFIVNKRATAMYRNQLESMNAYGSSSYNSKMFRDGGVVGLNELTDGRTVELLEELVAIGASPLRAYVSENELVQKSNTRIDNDIRSTL